MGLSTADRGKSDIKEGKRLARIHIAKELQERDLWLKGRRGIIGFLKHCGSGYEFQEIGKEVSYS